MNRIVKGLALCSLILLACQSEEAGQPSKLEPGRRDVVDGIRIGWDYSSSRRIAPANDELAGYYGYARMIQLHDGRLACVYESSKGNVELVLSSDLGDTWDSPQIVFETKDNISMAVPEIVELSNHAVLVVCNPRPREPYSDARKFGVKVRKSTDECQSWQAEQLIYEAQSIFENGCWEPSMVQFSNGELQLFFANEGIYTVSGEQNISMIKSVDFGDTWSAEPVIVGFRKDRRDGMPVPLLLEDRQELLIAVEDNKTGEFKPSIYCEKTNNNWTDGFISGEDSRRTYQPLSNPFGNETYAGAPYLARLATGEVLLSYQSTWERSNKWDLSNMVVEIGDGSGREFGSRSVPFEISTTKSCLWNSLAVIGNNTPVALTSTNAFSANSTEVWMRKGHVISELVIPNNTAFVDGITDDNCWSGEWPYFVGQKSEVHLSASVCIDGEYLYMAAKVNNSDLVIDKGSGESDGIVFQIDTDRTGYEAPHFGIYAFYLGADNSLIVKEGEFGDWKEIEVGNALQKKLLINDNSYIIEMAVPLNFFNTEWNSGKKLGINFILNAHFENGNFYQEGITGCKFNQPFSWCPLKYN